MGELGVLMMDLLTVLKWGACRSITWDGVSLYAFTMYICVIGAGVSRKVMNPLKGRAKAVKRHLSCKLLIFYISPLRERRTNCIRRAEQVYHQTSGRINFMICSVVGRFSYKDVKACQGQWRCFDNHSDYYTLCSGTQTRRWPGGVVLENFPEKEDIYLCFSLNIKR